MLTGVKSLMLGRYYSIIESYEYLNQEEHRNWQFIHMKKLLRQAEHHVPYYRRLFREIGFTAHDFKGLEDIDHLPFVSKEDIRAHGADAFCDERIPSLLRSHGNTGGSTGDPCPLLAFRPFTSLWRQAFGNQLWKRIGYQMGDRVAVLRGSVVLGSDRIYEFRKNEDRLILSTYDLSGERIQEYIDVINRFQIRFLHAYPSALALFIDCVSQLPYKVEFPYLKGVFVTSEQLMPNQRHLCERILGVRCNNRYGQTEMSLMSGWCEHTEKFHFFPQYGYLELIDTKGCRIDNSNKIGELVGTGFRNPAMILIRYRTGDIGSGLRWEKCTCEREFPTLDHIHGRIQDYVVSNNGQKIAVILFFGLHLPIFDCYRRVQLEQSEPGAVILRLESPDNGKHEREITLSKSLIEKALKDRLTVTFKEVENIPPMSNGKHKFVIQHVKATQSDEMIIEPTP